MNWDVRIPNRISKRIKKFPSGDRERVVAALLDFKDDPWRGDIVKLEGEENLWRRRVGNYRIFYTILRGVHVVEVNKVERRTSNTY